MEQIVLKPASTKADIQNIAALGEEIWREHYSGLLGEAQVAYMLDKFQSAPAVSAQLESGGYTYWLILDGETPCGYCGFVKEPDRLFLSKLYLRRDCRGKGIARQVLNALEKEAAGLHSIYLTVNKENNGSIAVYRHLGFRQIDAVKTDIGGGFFMDDYIMELPLAQ